MTDVMQLDLSGQGEDSLLVPFRNESNGPFFSPVGQGDAPPLRAPLSRFFRKRVPHEKDEKENLLSTSAMEELGVPVRDVSEHYAPLTRTGETPESDDEKESSSSGEDSSDDEDSSEDEEDSGDESDDEQNEEDREYSMAKNKDDARLNLRNQPSDRRMTFRPMWRRDREQNEGLLQDDSYRQKEVMEGYGNAPPPQKGEPDHAVGRFFRRLAQRRHDLKSMKVATEDTKDKRNLKESLAHAVAVVVAPELYAETEDQENTLGYYHSLVSHPEDDDEEVRQGQKGSVYAAKYWKQKSERLKARVTELERDLKNAELEGIAWKARTQELESELQTLREDAPVSPGSSSGEESMDDEGSKEGEVASEGEHEPHTEGVLIDIDSESDKPPGFDPLVADTQPEVDNGQHDLLQLSFDAREADPSDSKDLLGSEPEDLTQENEDEDTQA